MPTSTKDNRRLTGYRGNTDYQQSLYDDDMDDYQHYHTTGDDDTYEEYDEDLDDDDTHVQDDQDDTGSELSIPDSEINFDMVYALHTFAATVEGQASVVRGDALTLLDDSNSYWWLIKVLKTAEVGYIPAENIETPHERLARLNSHRNIELTRKDIQDAFPAPPSNSPKKTKRVTLAKGVQFQSQIIYGSSDDEDDYFEAEFEQWDERMRSDESDTDDMISEDESDDPYRYYGEQDLDQPIDMYTANYSQMNSNPLAVQNDIHPYQNTLSDATPIEADSDIINDALEPPVEDETIKISLTPSIARGYEESRRSSDSSIQNKLKKAAKLEKLLNATSPEPQQERRNSKEKKEKSSIRKFFSRSNSSGSSKESKKSKKNAQKNQDNNTLERQISAETASISSQSTGMMSIERDRVDSVDSDNMNMQQPSRLKINAGNITDFGDLPYKHAYVYPSTTANELIQQVIQQDPNQEPEEEEAYHDYHLIVRTLGGDEFTLVPSDKPLEIFHSLTAHLNTPMPSLKKARRISALMGSDNTHIGGPSSHAPTTDEEVQFYLYSKTKRTDDGEIQIKVSLFEEERTDKLVKIASHVLVKDAVPLLLEKFHILNGIVNGMDINSLRLDGDDDVVKYSLAVNRDGQEQLLDLNDKLLNVFGDQVPPIHYRRNSNPDRTSITANINPPDKGEVYFILKCVEKPKPIAVIQQELEENIQYHDARPHHRLVRQDTPMPVREATPTGGFQEPPIPSRDIAESPDMLTKPVLSSSPDSEPDIMSQLDEAIDTLTPTTDQKRSRHEAAESMLFCNDFGMNDMMVIIRGAAQKIEAPSNKYYTIRSEISDVFKDSQTRLEQLEKELDRIMAEAVKVHQ
ncbi:uncharacterized protein B0P05DRAFT_545824 [Gilbertella persicaria]|uniref:uncharacterized protein n=1 Tax=Gilbertella persicaria TaxID=101096 RepID=UPI00221FD9E8|nr:uncharacterized protein B0P05DRAFT_545824 [Gilbertella persicaria]KAI8076423.1 hypothetical protein B0P05DRAFT_545824 [Gilbertella persicaria]